MDKIKRIIAACCCCFLIVLLWSGSCTAEAVGGKKLIRKEVHDSKYQRAYGSHVITEYTYNEDGQKTKWTVSTAWDEDDEPEVETFYAEYNADGTLKREYSDLDSSTTYEYYNNGQLRSESTPWSIKHYDPFGKRMDARPWELYVSERDEPIYCTPEERRYQYDDAGRIILFEVKRSYGDEPMSYEYSYDEQGRISKVTISNSDLNSIEFLYMSGGSYIIRWKQENYDHSYVWEEEYNENNQIVRYRNTSSFFDETGTANPENDYGINYTYNTEGDLISETGWGQSALFIPYITDYQYERSNGLETVIETRYNGGLRDESGTTYKTEYQYDQDGDLVKKSEYECDENGILESSPYYTETYVYEGAAQAPIPTLTQTSMQDATMSQEEKQMEEQYQTALKKLESNSLEDCFDGLEILLELGDYKDAKSRSEELINEYGGMGAIAESMRAIAEKYLGGQDGVQNPDKVVKWYNKSQEWSRKAIENASAALNDTSEQFEKAFERLMDVMPK